MVAAAGYHTLLFENEKVRVLHTRIPPGATAPIHTHRWPCVVFIQSWSDCIRRDHLGNVLVELAAKFGDAEIEHAYLATTAAAAFAGKHW